MRRSTLFEWVRIALLGLIWISSNTTALLRAQSSPSMLVSTDAKCTWTLDGVPQGVLTPDDMKLVKISAGDHVLTAASIDGVSTFQKTVTVTSSLQGVVKFPLARNYPVWNDPSTGLIWTRSDNTADVAWPQAAEYCNNLQLAGQSGWRLPTIDELQAIANQPQDDHDYHIKGGIRLSGFTWSANSGRSAGEAWVIYFVNGTTYTHYMSDSHNGRALCVRQAGSSFASVTKQTTPLPSSIKESLPPPPTAADKAAATLSTVVNLLEHDFKYVHYFPGPAAPDDWHVKVSVTATITRPCVLEVVHDYEEEYDGQLHNRQFSATYYLAQTNPDDLHLIVVNETARPLLYAITGVKGAKQLTVGPDEDLTRQVGSYLKGAASLCGAQ
jgi:hypothetical protein